MIKWRKREGRFGWKMQNHPGMAILFLFLFFVFCKSLPISMAALASIVFDLLLFIDGLSFFFAGALFFVLPKQKTFAGMGHKWAAGMANSPLGIRKFIYEGWQPLLLAITSILPFPLSPSFPFLQPILPSMLGLDRFFSLLFKQVCTRNWRQRTNELAIPCHTMLCAIIRT